MSKELGVWLTLPNFHMDINQLAKFKWQTDGFHKKIIISNLCNLCYHIWRTQKEAIWLLQMNKMDKVIKRIKCETRVRFYTLYHVESQTSI